MGAALPPQINLSDMSAVLYPMNDLEHTSYKWTITVDDPAEWVYLASGTAPGEEIPVTCDGRTYNGTVAALDWDTQVVTVVV